LTIAEEYFPVSEYNICLQVISCGFRNTEIFHSIRNRQTKVFANPEKVIYSCSAGENNSTVIQDMDPVFPEVFPGNAFYFDEFMKFDIYAVLPGKLSVR